MKYVLERVDLVKKARLAAKDKGTHRLAERSHQFRDLNNPDYFIAIPKTSSEDRKYIPISFFGKEFIPSDSLRIIPNGDLFLFGQLMSQMHMAWVKYVCGRLKSDFRYSKDIVYNNYPFPEAASEAHKNRVSEAAQVVLDVRDTYQNSSLADLYDPLTMPPDLTKAHQNLDKAVDLCYRPQAFVSELSRIEYLFGLYEAYTAPIFKAKKNKKTVS